MIGWRKMASFGESWNCGLGAAGAFVVALAARRSWFCCHRLVAVLLQFGRRRTGLAEKAALGGVFLGALADAMARGQSPLCGPPAGPGRLGRWAVGG